MTKAQENKINQIREELETIAKENGGILDKFETTPLDCNEIAVDFRITAIGGHFIDFDAKKHIYARETLFVGVRGGVTYINCTRKNCPIRPVRDIKSVFRKNWVHDI